MSRTRYTAEFKAEALKQVVDRGYSVADVSERLGVSMHSLYAWLRAAGNSREQRKADRKLPRQAHTRKVEFSAFWIR